MQYIALNSFLRKDNCYAIAITRKLKMTKPLLQFLALFIACVSLPAQTILINFGATSYSGSNSPGHDSGNITGTSWNVAATDTASGILDQDGNATSVSLDFGTTETDTGLTVNYANATKQADYSPIVGASPEQLGLFDTALGKSNVVRDGSGLPGVAVSVSGLAPGDYVFYATAFRGDNENNIQHAYDIYAGTSSGPITDFSALSAGFIDNFSEVGEWTDDFNYVEGAFTIDGTNDTFSLLSQSDDFIGVLNSLEVYQATIPEPSVYGALLGLGIFSFACGLRRKRREL